MKAAHRTTLMAILVVVFACPTMRAARGQAARGSGTVAMSLAAVAQQAGPTPDIRDHRYGPHERNVLDAYKAKSERPTPVLIFFHGGGFVGGDKLAGGMQALFRECLHAGISVVSANYRFVSPDRDGQPGTHFPAPMLDGARVVQYVRAKGGAWNVDPQRIALSGGSAGACMSIWIATHDDLAQPNSDDPVARLSTRVSCVVAYGGQTTLDPREIRKYIGGNPNIHPSLLPFFGVRSINELDASDKKPLVAAATSLNYVTQDDPPLYLVYGGELADAPLPPTASINTSIHHAMFGKLIQDKYQPLGIPCYLQYSSQKPPLTAIEFLRRQLKGEPGPR